MTRINRRDVLAATSSAAGVAALGGVAVAGRTTASCRPGTFEGGDGSASSPYRIATVEQLQCMQAGPGASYELVDHVDASAVDFEPVGTPDERFSGSLAGNGYEIRGLTVDRPDGGSAGLFGFLDGGWIVDVHLVEATVVGERATGALVGRMEAGSLVEGSSATGSVSAGISAGGLVGVASHSAISQSSASCEVIARERLSQSRPYNVGGLVGSLLAGEITGSFADGNASGNRFVGGLVGVSRTSGSTPATVTESYALTNVSGEQYVGGLVGLLGGGTVSESYAAGQVAAVEDAGGLVGVSEGGTVTNGYWDVEATGQDDSAGGTGLVTAQMSMYPSKDMQGFDFEETWYSTQAETYPILRWQRGPSVEIAAVEPVQVVFENPALEGPDHVLVDGKETAVLLDLRIEDAHLLEGGVTVELDGTVEGPPPNVRAEDEDWNGSLLPQTVEVSRDQLRRWDDSDAAYLEGVLEEFPLTGTVEHPFDESSPHSFPEGEGIIEMTVTPENGPSTSEAVRIDVVETDDLDLRFYRQRAAEGVAVEGVNDYEEAREKSTTFVEATYPFAEGGLRAEDDGGFDLGAGSGLFGDGRSYDEDDEQKLLADLEQRAYESGGSGTMAVGVCSAAGMNYLVDGRLGYTFLGKETPIEVLPWYTAPNNAMIVNEWAWVALAHELGHQLGLHNDLEEYKYPDEHRSGQDATGYWVDRETHVTGRRAFMERSTFRSLEEHWLSNSCDYCGYEGDEGAGNGDFYDYDFLLATLSHRSLRDGYREACGADGECEDERTTWATGGRLTSDLESQATDTPAKPTEQPDEPVEQVLYLKGTIGKDGDVQARQWRLYHDATPSHTPDGDYAFVATDGDGEAVRETGYSVRFEVCTLSEGGFEETDRAPYSFAMEFPPAAERVELRKDGEPLDSFDARVELLRGAVDSLPVDAYESSADAEQCHRDLHASIDDLETRLAEDDDAGAAEALRTEFRPAADRCLQDDYEPTRPLATSKADLLETADEVRDRIDHDDGSSDEWLAAAALGALATAAGTAYAFVRWRNDDEE